MTVSLCPSCHCMTNTIKGYCGKCKMWKRNLTVEEMLEKTVNELAKTAAAMANKALDERDAWKKKFEEQESKIKILTEALEKISWGIVEMPPDANGIKFVRIRGKLEIEGIANNALRKVIGAGE